MSPVRILGGGGSGGAGSGAPPVPLTVIAGSPFLIASNQQVLFSEVITIQAGAYIKVASGSVLKKVP